MNRPPTRWEPGAQEGVVPYRRSDALQVVAPADYDETPGEGGAHQFWKILQSLLRRRWLIIAVVVVGLSAAAAWTLTRTPLFRASATLEVQRQEVTIIEGAEVAPTTVADAEHMATQNALLKSRALAERVAEVLDLPADERFADPDGTRSERLAEATDAILGNLDILPVTRSRVIEIRVRGPYAAETARIANAVAENFIEMDLERRYNATSYARRFLEERLATTKAALEETEKKLIAYSQQEGILDLSSVGGSEIGTSLDASSLVALNAAVTDAESSRIEAEQRYREAQTNPAAKDILDSPTIQELRKRRAELMGEYQQKLSQFKAEYPAMKELSARISAIEREIDLEAAKVVSALQGEYRTAVSREEALRQRVEELKGQVQDLRGRSIDYNILSREVDTLRGQYDAILQRFKEVSIAGGVGASRVSIVDRAETPLRPYDPDLRSELIRALVLSLALAIGLALLLEYIDDTIKTPDDVKSKLGLAVIGMAPRVKGRVRIAEHLRDPRSPISEAFSSARTALQFATTSGAPRSLLVTGVRPTEGKTSTTLSLAVSFANSGARVLIVDADLRRPSFAAIPGASVGLSGYLTTNVKLLPNVIPGEFENVFLLPAGVIPPNPAELLSGPRMKELLREAQDAFDIVIVDSPPVLDFADSPSLGAICQATVLVLQSGSIRRPVALRTIDRLLEARTNIVGVILTKFDARKSSYAYGYGYGYGYGDNTDRKALSSEAMRRRRIESFAAKDASLRGHHDDTGM